MVVALMDASACLPASGWGLSADWQGKQTGFSVVPAGYFSGCSFKAVGLCSLCLLIYCEQPPGYRLCTEVGVASRCGTPQSKRTKTGLCVSPVPEGLAASLLELCPLAKWGQREPQGRLRLNGWAVLTYIMT